MRGGGGGKAAIAGINWNETARNSLSTIIPRMRGGIEEFFVFREGRNDLKFVRVDESVKLWK